MSKPIHYISAMAVAVAASTTTCTRIKFSLVTKKQKVQLGGCRSTCMGCRQELNR